MTVYDMHCHMGFADQSDPTCSLHVADPRLDGFLCATVTPQEFKDLQERHPEHPMARFALGLHPQWVTKGICDESSLQLFCELVGDAAFVSEVGLDYREMYVAGKEGQLACFHGVLSAVQNGERVLSIHTSEAEREVLDLMEEYGTFRNNRCVFHWFSGSCDQLHRAIKLGAYFSGGLKMTKSKRGREYLKVIPKDRLLLETDYPRGEDAQFSASAQADMLCEIVEAMEHIRGEHLREYVAGTSAELLGR